MLHHYFGSWFVGVWHFHLNQALFRNGILILKPFRHLHPSSPRTYSFVAPFHGSLPMKPFDLELVKLYIETADELLKDIVTFIH